LRKSERSARSAEPSRPIGAGRGDGPGRHGVRELSEKKERKRGQDGIQKEVRERAGDDPRDRPRDRRGGKGHRGEAVHLAVRGEDIGLLKGYAAALKQEIRKIPGIVDLEVTRGARYPGSIA